MINQDDVTKSSDADGFTDGFKSADLRSNEHPEWWMVGVIVNGDFRHRALLPLVVPNGGAE